MSKMSLVDRQSCKDVWANGIRNNLPRSNGTVIGRDALGTRCGKLPRSTICEMQARNRLLEYANCMSMALDVLAGRFKYYSWRSRKVCCMCLFGKWGAMYGVVCLGNVSGLGKCNSITGLGQ